MESTYGSQPISFYIVLVIFSFIALLPTFIALKKDHEHKYAIIVINIFGGMFMGIGWIVAMIWCAFDKKVEIKDSESQVREMEVLLRLKEKGIISESEFNKKKLSFLE